MNYEYFVNVEEENLVKDKKDSSNQFVNKDKINSKYINFLKSLI